MSEKYRSGGHAFTEEGTYIIHVKPIVEGRRHGRETRIRVSYRQSDWAATRVIDASLC
jgi:hypothetical protein